MRFQIIFYTTIFSFAFALSACTAEKPANSANANSTNKIANTASSSANNPMATNRTPEAATNNNAPTLAPVVQNYFTALQKKDETSAKKYLSQSAIAYWRVEMKDSKNSSLLAVLEDDGTPVEEKREIRNEQIQGETATAEIKGGSSGDWTKIKFVRENGEWKFASPKESMSLQNIERTDSNTAK